jgi:hypothetical protein
MIEAIGVSEQPTIPPLARALNNADAALVWLMNWSGDDRHVIAMKLGTMPSKVEAILTEKTHVGSRTKASQMFPERANG